jgi:Dipeptidyl aminopeptidases/acylaminoacyl-peptidases
MKHFIISIVFLLCTCISCVQGKKTVNYNESKVPAFNLPDLLTCNDGTKVTTVKQWEEVRRAEIFEFFSSQVYGSTPEDVINVTYETISENLNFMEGKATSKQIKFTFTNGKKSIEAILFLVLPNWPTEKIPVFVAYNYKGNHSTCFDTTIEYTPAFSLVKKPDDPDWARGCQSNRWCYDKIIERGYGIATMFYQDIFPDIAGLEPHGIASLFLGYTPNTIAPDQWQALGAWAWGSSRIVDFLESQERVDLDKIIVMGHSRHGKAALWAGAQDERFKIVISNDSGCGGAALSKREYGETVASITKSFPHWFCPNFNQYANNEKNMPFDQHELVALIAPRKVYIASAIEDTWADPKGEFLSGYYAGAVYELYGLKGLDTANQPPVHQPVMNDVGYHLREGIHDVTDYDWLRFMDFADKHFGLVK